MIIEVIKNAVLQNIGELKAAPKGWFKRNCMLCHTQGHGKDTRYRFGIQFNAQSIALNCFNCGFSAGYSEGKELSKSFKFFLRHLHINEKLIEQLEFEIFKSRNQISVVREGDETKVKNIEDKFKSLFQKWQPRDLPKDSLPISEWLKYDLNDKNFIQVANYAINRKLFDLDNFYWTPDPTHSLNQRLIIPYYYKNNIVGFTARICFNPDNKSIPKYYQQSPPDFIYNLDNQQAWSRKYAIVTEGVLDAWAVDGIGILGELGQSKIDIINRMQKQIIVCPDRDKKGYDLVKAAMENGWAVSFPNWDISIKDAADSAIKYGRLLTVHSIISSAVIGKEKIQLKWEIEQNERNRKQRY